MIDRRLRTGAGLIGLAAAVAVAGCGEEPSPRSVSEFMEDPILLDATMVRCVEGRVEARYDPECLNARDAADRIAAREEQERRTELEAESERKRQAVRRAQEAAAEARRRALEEQRRREEVELLGPFAPLPERYGQPQPDPSRDRPPAGEVFGRAPAGTGEEPSQDEDAASPPEEQRPDLESIRFELERRQSVFDQ